MISDGGGPIRDGKFGSREQIKDVKFTCFLEFSPDILSLSELQNLAGNLVHKNVLKLGNSCFTSSIPALVCVPKFMCNLYMCARIYNKRNEDYSFCAESFVCCKI